MFVAGPALHASMSGTASSPSPSPIRKPADAPDLGFFTDAACRGADTSIFFPVSDSLADEAKQICAACPVAEQCLEYAVATHQPDGVWGGLTGQERHRLVRRRQKLAREARERSSAA